MAKPWTEEEISDVERLGFGGDKGCDLPWRKVADLLNKTHGNNRSVEACRQRAKRAVCDG